MTNHQDFSTPEAESEVSFPEKAKYLRLSRRGHISSLGLVLSFSAIAVVFALLFTLVLQPEIDFGQTASIPPAIDRSENPAK